MVNYKLSSAGRPRDFKLHSQSKERGWQYIKICEKGSTGTSSKVGLPAWAALHLNANVILGQAVICDIRQDLSKLLPPAPGKTIVNHV